MARTLLQTAKRRGPLIAGSILLHAAVLLLIALSPSREIRTPPPADIVFLPLDLTPGTVVRRRRAGAAAASSASRAAGDQTAPRDADVPAARTPVSSPPGPAVQAGAPMIEDGWRVRAGLGPPARIPCPAAPGDRIGQRLCLVGRAPDQDREPEVHAAIPPSRQDASDRSREEGFERQAQANEAWRDYTRGEGAYPGLRSLFRDR